MHTYNIIIYTKYILLFQILQVCPCISPKSKPATEWHHVLINGDFLKYSNIQPLTGINHGILFHLNPNVFLPGRK